MQAISVAAIAPGTLDAALEAIHQQTGLQIVYVSAITLGKKSNGAPPGLPVAQTLTHVLEGTGLTYEWLDGKTVRVKAIGEARNGALALSQPEMRLAQANSPQSAGVGVGQSASDTPALTPEGSVPRADEEGLSAAGLEEIVVTAQKRAERLIDTPQSVSVVSGADLAKLGAVQFSDFANTVPGLSFSTAGAGNTQITLRGVTVGFDISPTVGLYVDEVPYGSSTVFNLGAQFALDTALFDVDRVEVLRGPQGTLYGASAMGGLIKYVTQRPDTNRFGVDLQAGVSSTGDGGGINYNVASAVNLPVVSDKAAFRISGFESHNGGFIDNLALSRKDVNSSDIYGGRVDFLATPTEALSVRLTGFAQDISRDGEGTADYTSQGGQPYGSLGQYRRFNEPFHEQFRLGSATVGYDFGPMSLTSISAYQSSQLQTFWDISSVYVPYGLCPCSAIGLPDRANTDKFTEEVRVSSNPGARAIEWVLGAFYNHESSRTSEYFQLQDLAGNPLPNNLYTYFVPSTFREYALFGDLTWHITNRVDITGGVRDAHNHQEFTQYGSGALGASLPTNSSAEANVTYLADARYHFNDHAMGYLRYATGYRPGGPNIVTIAGGARTFASDSLRSYEVGFKAATADGRFSVDVDSYLIDWSNIQIGAIRSGFQTYTNAPGGATIQGAELTLSMRPIRNLTATGAFAYQHAYMNEAEADLKAAQGERLPNVPRFTATLNADYLFATAGLQPTVGATLRNVAERNTSFDASVSYPQYRLPEYTIVDVRAGLTFGRVSTQLYVHNVFDKRGQLSVIFPQFGDRVAILQPRTAGISFSTKF